MGFRFRRSVKIAPGVRLNFGKKSTSVSFGGKGARYTVSSTGKKTASVGIPGTGLSYVETFGGGKNTRKESSAMAKKEKTPKQKTKKPFYKKWWFWIIAVLIIGTAAGSGTEEQVPDRNFPNFDESDSDIITTIPETEDEPAQEDLVNLPVAEKTEEAPAEPEPVPEQPKEEPKEEVPVVVAPVPEEPVAETPSQEPVGTTYILNTNTMKFHEEGCPSVKDIHDHNMSTYTGNRDDVIAKGFDPCGRCHP